MRASNIWVVLSVVVLLGVSGCSKTDEDTNGSGQSVTEQMQQQAGQAMDTASQFAGKTKDEVVAAAQQQLNQLQQKYQQWKAEHPAETEQAKQKLSELQGSVESHLKTASDSLSKAKEAGADAWQTTASATHDALVAAQNAYDQLLSYVKTTATEPNQPSTVGE